MGQTASGAKKPKTIVAMVYFANKNEIAFPDGRMMQSLPVKYRQSDKKEKKMNAWKTVFDYIADTYRYVSAIELSSSLDVDQDFVIDAMNFLRTVKIFPTVNQDVLWFGGTKIILRNKYIHTFNIQRPNLFALYSYMLTSGLYVQIQMPNRMEISDS